MRDFSNEDLSKVVRVILSSSGRISVAISNDCIVSAYSYEPVYQILDEWEMAKSAVRLLAPDLEDDDSWGEVWSMNLFTREGLWCYPEEKSVESAGEATDPPEEPPDEAESSSGLFTSVSFREAHKRISELTPGQSLIFSSGMLTKVVDQLPDDPFLDADSVVELLMSQIVDSDLSIEVHENEKTGDVEFRRREIPFGRESCNRAYVIPYFRHLYYRSGSFWRRKRKKGTNE